MILMHDGAPAHTAHAIRNLLQQQNIQQLPWPSKSPDFNVIEHLWDELNRRVRRRAVQPRNLPELEQALVQEWRNIPQRFLRNYVMPMRQKCMKVLQAQGEHIGY
jgi:transposase